MSEQLVLPSPPQNRESVEPALALPQPPAQEISSYEMTPEDYTELDKQHAASEGDETFDHHFRSELTADKGGADEWSDALQEEVRASQDSEPNPQVDSGSSVEIPEELEGMRSSLSDRRVRNAKGHFVNNETKALINEHSERVEQPAIVDASTSTDQAAMPILEDYPPLPHMDEVLPDLPDMHQLDDNDVPLSPRILDDNNPSAWGGTPNAAHTPNTPRNTPNDVPLTGADIDEINRLLDADNPQTVDDDPAQELSRRERFTKFIRNNKPGAVVTRAFIRGQEIRQGFADRAAERTTEEQEKRNKVARRIIIGAAAVGLAYAIYKGYEFYQDSVGLGELGPDMLPDTPIGGAEGGLVEPQAPVDVTPPVAPDAIPEPSTLPMGVEGEPSAPVAPESIPSTEIAEVNVGDGYGTSHIAERYAGVSFENSAQWDEFNTRTNGLFADLPGTYLDPVDNMYKLSNTGNFQIPQAILDEMQRVAEEIHNRS